MDMGNFEHTHKDFMPSIYSPDQSFGGSSSHAHPGAMQGQDNHQAQQQSLIGYPSSSSVIAAGILHPGSSSAIQYADPIGNLFAGMDSQPQSMSVSSQPLSFPSQAALLEQQFKLSQLQQLQQLQNQIFQQQIALISSSSKTPVSIDPSVLVDRLRDQAPFHGLPTPQPSTEIRPQPPIAVSPMILQQMDQFPQNPFRRSDFDMSPLDTGPAMAPHHHSHHNHNHHLAGTSSAPANIVFDTTSAAAPELDFDVSPLVSPWLGAHQNAPQSSSSLAVASSSANTGPTPGARNKRTASPSSGEHAGPGARQIRKRTSPGSSMVLPPAAPKITKKIPSRGSKSATSTPLFGYTRRKEGGAEDHNTAAAGAGGAGDTPSPVDLSSAAMPPPPDIPMQATMAPVVTEPSPSSAPAEMAQSSSSSQSNTTLMRVTPSSILKLGNIGMPTGSAPIDFAGGSGHVASGLTNIEKDVQAQTRESMPKNGKNANRKLPSISPGLKPILPAQASPTVGPTRTGDSQPVKKTSHKAAEQKRRDSLKTTFDELRGLLPPIPLPSDENFPDEPILPGALPPRGPPKAGGPGPNKGVSKLQLLICANEFIKILTARVERRDDEISKLRREVARLRGLGRPNDDSGAMLQEDEEPIDLEHDLDAVERTEAGRYRSTEVSKRASEEDADDEDDDE